MSCLHLFVSYCGYLKLAENNTSVEHYLDEYSYNEGYKNEDIGDNESIVPDSDPDCSDIEGEGFSDHTDF